MFKVLEEETENKSINELWDGFRNSQPVIEIIGINTIKTKEWLSEDTKRKREEKCEIKAKINSRKAEQILEKLNEEYNKILTSIEGEEKTNTNQQMH